MPGMQVWFNARKNKNILNDKLKTPVKIKNKIKMPESLLEHCNKLLELRRQEKRKKKNRE